MLIFTFIIYKNYENVILILLGYKNEEKNEREMKQMSSS